MYSVDRVEPREPIGPARSLDHALMLADAGGPARYEVIVIGDVPTHLCFITRHEDNTFTIDPRLAGGLMANTWATRSRGPDDNAPIPHGSPKGPGATTALAAGLRGN